MINPSQQTWREETPKPCASAQIERLHRYGETIQNMAMKLE
jgi:hypothetical protein